MTRTRPAVHRTILVVDVEGFGDRLRTNPHQVAVRDGLYRALRRALRSADIRWSICDHEDRGDGLFVLAPPRVPKSRFVGTLPLGLADALREHNTTHRREEHIRLRMALHAGEVTYDEHGVAGAAINLAFRLIEAAPLKAALAASPGVLAVVVSSWFFDEVVRHSVVGRADLYRPYRVTVKETTTVGWIYLPDQPAPPAGLPDSPADLELPVPRQLPVAIGHFAGRVAELDQITALLEETADTGGAVVISAIDGTAGIGKTTLAVHWSHQVANRFPDGQLYVNLRGFDPSGTPMTPGEAVRGFLNAFHTAPDQVPADLEAQAALYRSVLTDRKVLVVLDNARNVEQVRPLLPGSAGCLVVVTSRNRLAGLVTAEGARPLTLDLLPVAEARQLLIGRVGAGRVAAEPEAVQKIIACCSRLPLALSIVAARAATNPTFSLSALARELQQNRDSLDAFDGGEVTNDMRAVFSWSYRWLTTDAARLFRLLGLHPGPDISMRAAASLAGLSTRQVRPVMGELARAHLVEERRPGRFTFHDLLRTYATEQAAALDSDAERTDTVRRILDHYLHTAHAAARLLHPRREPVSPIPCGPGVTPEPIAEYDAAWSWFETEHPVLLAVVQLAAADRFDVHAWQLPCMLEEFLLRRGYTQDWSVTHHVALEAAQRDGNKHGQAHIHRSLGRALPWLGRHDEAYRHLTRAISLFEELRDPIGQADAHLDLGAVFEQQGRPQAALGHAQQGLALSRAAAYQAGQPRALNLSGWCQALLGELRPALEHLTLACALFRERGDRRGESRALNNLGYTHHRLGRHDEAVVHYRQALVIERDLGDRYGEATTLARMGDAQQATGDVPGARHTWQQALAILDHVGLALGTGLAAGYPDADQVRDKLRLLDRAADKVDHRQAPPP